MDVTSLTTLFAWWAGIAPAIATSLTVAWVSYCFLKEILGIKYMAKAMNLIKAKDKAEDKKKGIKQGSKKDKKIDKKKGFKD